MSEDYAYGRRPARTVFLSLMWQVLGVLVGAGMIYLGAVGIFYQRALMGDADLMELVPLHGMAWHGMAAQGPPSVRPYRPEGTHMLCDAVLCQVPIWVLCGALILSGIGLPPHSTPRPC